MQSKVFGQAIKILGNTIEDMDLQIEQKDEKNRILRKKIG